MKLTEKNGHYFNNNVEKYTSHVMNLKEIIFTSKIEIGRKIKLNNEMDYKTIMIILKSPIYGLD